MSIKAKRRRETRTHTPVHLSSRRTGLTLIEMIAAIGIASIVMLSAALLVQSGYKGFNQTYNNANCESRLGALDTMTALGAIGRKSNRLNYRVYEVTGNSFEQVLPSADPEEILTGQAVEFRYWSSPELDSDLMDPATTATAYALFYLDNGKLKIDYGPYPPGGINSSGYRITGDDVITTILAENVTSVEFSHTAKNMTGDGRGCVRMKLVIADPEDDTPKTTIAATLMRNSWPY